MPSQTAKKPRTKKTRSQAKVITSGRSWLVIGRRPFTSLMTLAFAILFVAVGGYLIYNASRAGSQPELKSDLASQNYCLTDDNDGGPGSYVSAYLCNGSPSQYFSTRSAKNGPE